MACSTDFSGKTVLVTGSSSGIGEEIAVQFAKYGAQVMVTGLGEENIAKVVARCNAVSPEKLVAIGVECDITDDEGIGSLVTKTIDTFGGLDILVNNAGIASFIKIGDQDFISKFDAVMNVNLRAHVVITNLCVPHLIKSKGNIVNMSSIAGMHPYKYSTPYCASKAGLDMFTQCLALELGPKGIRVNSVNPGPTETPIYKTLGFGFAIIFRILRIIKFFKLPYYFPNPLGRIGEVEDIAKMVLFLASNDASFVTGLNAQVDGGALYTMKI